MFANVRANLSPMADITRALLSRDEAATYLGIKLTKLYELTNGGHLGDTVTLPPPPDGTPGGRGPGRRWKKAELDAFIERNSVSRT